MNQKSCNEHKRQRNRMGKKSGQLVHCVETMDGFSVNAIEDCENCFRIDSM